MLKRTPFLHASTRLLVLLTLYVSFYFFSNSIRPFSIPILLFEQYIHSIRTIQLFYSYSLLFLYFLFAYTSYSSIR